MTIGKLKQTFHIYDSLKDVKEVLDHMSISRMIDNTDWSDIILMVGGIDVMNRNESLKSVRDEEIIGFSPALSTKGGRTTYLYYFQSEEKRTMFLLKHS